MKRRAQVGDSASWFDPMLQRDRHGVVMEVGERIAIVRDANGRSESVPLPHLILDAEEVAR